MATLLTLLVHTKMKMVKQFIHVSTQTQVEWKTIINLTSQIQKLLLQ